VGCGVGGPARSIARFSGCKVVGLNNNAYQIERGSAMNERDGLQDRIKFVKGDFMRMPFAPNSFDAAYAVEATCHAPDRVGVYREIFKALKPGGVFGSYEWVTTDLYDPANAEHRAIKKGIEVGDSLPDLVSTGEVVAALRKAGFVVEEAKDLAADTQVPWTAPFLPSYTLTGFRTTPLGLWLTDTMVSVMETLRLAPAGTTEMHRHLLTGACAAPVG
jgi:sterol 24-C-methyltransferase